MAWVDDRVWSIPKFVSLSDKAFRVWVNSVAYSSGYGLRGRLESEHQKVLGATPKVRKELVEKRCWDELGDGAIEIHDWHVHNAKRDKRREEDKARKQATRAAIKAGLSATLSAGQSAGQSLAASTVAARVETVEGSEGSDLPPLSSIVPSASKPRGDDKSSLGKLRGACRVEEGSDEEERLKRAMRGVAEVDVLDVIYAVRTAKPDSPLGYALGALKKRKERAA